jgi:hypothetical protein
MALTPEQQFQLDLENARHANVMALEQMRLNSNEAVQATAASIAAKQAKLEAVRLAKETLIENARSKPVDSREVSAADIAAFAAALESHING